MGNTEVTPATAREIDEHFNQETFSISRSCDVEKLKAGISNLPIYVGTQKLLEQEWDKKKTKLSEILKNRSFLRKGIPDIKRRAVFLEVYGLESHKCKAAYKAVYEDTNKEELEIAQEDRPTLPFVHNHYLNETGMNNLEIVVHLLNKEKHIEYSPVLINSIALLLIYLPVEETYCVAQKMMETSSKILADPKTKKLMRWYFSFTKSDYFHMLGAFIQSYIDTTKFKKRSILIKLQSIGFDINELLDEMFKFCFTTFLKADHAIDVFSLFYLEGTKILFRFAYAILKEQKEVIKTIEKADKVQDTLKEAALSKTNWTYLHEKAFKYKLARGHYDINKTDQVVLNDEREEYKIVSDFLPNVDECPSTILSMKQFYRLWMMLPEYLQVRVPNLVYSSMHDGYNLSTLYQKLKPYEEKNSVKCVFLTIKTLEEDVFGVFLDAVVYKSVKHYIGSSESFVYGFYEDKRITHYSERKNDQYCIGGVEYLQFGGGGDGPAIYLKDTLQEGQTNACETFANDVLTSSKSNFFQVASIEVILI